jgi:ATP-dependent RNA helicase RhlE
MLDLGFVKPIRQVASRLPKDRQNLFFSATMPGEIGKLAGELLNNPAQVSVTPQATTVEKISQQILFVEAGRKRALLSELFADPAWSRTLVFTRTKRGADRVAAYLEAGGSRPPPSTATRARAARAGAGQLQGGRRRCLVATDIAARGIDVEAVTHVVNYELPYVPEAYVHRIGRTARAGAGGVAVSLCADDERNLLKDIQKLTRQTIPAFDRRNDRALGALDAAIEASSPKIKAMPPRPGGGRGDGRGGGQPQRRPAPAPRSGSYDPLASERGAPAAQLAEGARKPQAAGSPAGGPRVGLI